MLSFLIVLLSIVVYVAVFFFQYFRDVTPSSSHLHCFCGEICCPVLFLSICIYAIFFWTAFKIFPLFLVLSYSFVMCLGILFMFLVLGVCEHFGSGG